MRPPSCSISIGAGKELTCIRLLNYLFLPTDCLLNGTQVIRVLKIGKGERKPTNKLRKLICAAQEKKTSLAVSSSKEEIQIAKKENSEAQHSPVDCKLTRYT